MASSFIVSLRGFQQLGLEGCCTVTAIERLSRGFGVASLLLPAWPMSCLEGGYPRSERERDTSRLVRVHLRRGDFEDGAKMLTRCVKPPRPVSEEHWYVSPLLGLPPPRYRSMMNRNVLLSPSWHAGLVSSPPRAPWFPTHWSAYTTLGRH